MGYLPVPKAQVLRAALEKQEKPKRALLTLTEAAEILRMSKWTIYRLLDEHQLRAIKIRSRRLIPASEIERFIAARLAEGAA